MINQKMESYGIQRIVQRLNREAEDSLITKTYRHLERSKGEGGVDQTTFEDKERETEVILSFASDYELWFSFDHFSIFLDEGAEQKVFYKQESNKVIKLNDAIFYVNWS
jgi:hypothetical protein